MSNAMNENKNLKDFIQRANWDLSPLTVLYLFKKIPENQIELLNLNSLKGKPEDMIMQQLLVPPACIRPSVQMGTTGSNEDDLTVKIGDIVFINNVIEKQIQSGATPSNIVDHWDFLQQQVAMYINSDLPGFPKTIGMGKPIRALIQRLKGKTGRFRGNLSGKRVDFSSRTVISPDPNLRIDEVGVPITLAKILTYPERVTKHNIRDLKAAILNGPDVHPGANMVEFVSSGLKVFLKFGRRADHAAKLNVGDVVERHIRNGDVVLFNRQPSLHRMSIMAHRARILQDKTFRFNECCCQPYNADFDGDEMNLHVPQTEEAKTEAITLMGVTSNLITPRHGEPLIAATQDFLTTSFLLTQRDVFYTKFEFCQLTVYFNDALEKIQLPPPAILKPIKLWTGKQLFSLLLRPSKTTLNPRLKKPYPNINIELREKNYSQSSLGNSPYLCPKDGFVVIKASELIIGNIAKGTIGGDKNGLLYAIIRHCGSEVAAEFLNRIAKFSSRWIGNRGFSIGIDDVTPSTKLMKIKEEKISKGYKDCEEFIKQYEAGKLQTQPGCNEDETLEALCLGELSRLREDLGKECEVELDHQHNAPLIMATCGSKGSRINISQMVMMVGQQAVSGHRIPNGFIHRTLPHFPKWSRDPDAKGFVKNSFYSGLSATEFFMHTQGGREGLVDTAVKTAETGYMQRRLMKCLEDLCIQYDGTVRTSEQNIVQFVYGDDGLDPLTMAQGTIPVNFSRLLEVVKCKYPSKSNDNCLFPTEILKISKKLIHSQTFENDVSSSFLDKLEAFIKQIANEIKDTFTKLNIDIHEENNNTKEEDSLASSWHIIHQCHNNIMLTSFQLTTFINECHRIYLESRIQSGTAVGAIAAQSIGEPGTQMTLKSLDWKEEIVVREEGKWKIVKIGQFIDEMMEKYCKKVEKPLEEGNEMGDTHILQIESLIPIISVPSVDENGNVVLRRVTHLTKHLPINSDGTNTLIKVKTSGGREVIATKAKSFLTRINNKLIATRGDQLTLGMRLPVSTTLPFPQDGFDDFLEISPLFPRISLTEEWGFFFGVFITVDSCSDSHVEISTNNDKEFRNRISHFIESLEGVCGHIHCTSSFENDKIIIYSSSLAKIMVEYCGHLVNNKKIPDFVYSANDTFVKGFLDGYFSGDGSIADDSIQCSSVNEVLIDGLQFLLTRFNIYSVKTGPVMNMHLRLHLYPSWKLSINNRDIGRFVSQIPLTINYKQKAALSIAKRNNQYEHNLDDRIPGIKFSDDLLKIIFTLIDPLVSAHAYADAQEGIFSRDFLTKLHNNNNLKNINNSDKSIIHNAITCPIVYETIESIDEVPPSHFYVYDLTVEHTKTFMHRNLLFLYDTFHFAGVASMNITLGVPRIKEIINAAKNISSPIITAPLDSFPGKSTDETFARLVKGRIEKTLLGEITEYIEQVFSPRRCYVNIKLNMKAISSLQLGVTVKDVVEAILRTKKLKFKLNQVEECKDAIIRIYPYSPISEIQKEREREREKDSYKEYQKNKDLLFTMANIQRTIGQILVQGVQDVNRAVITKTLRKSNNSTVYSNNNYEYQLLVEGTNLLGVMGTLGVDSKKTTSNHIDEMFKVLGIEAGRRAIIEEIHHTMQSHGLSIDNRHVALLADIMSYRGEILGITRFGIAKMKESVLMLASFEKTADHLFEAAIRGTSDQISGVSECIIMGTPIPVGTGIFKLMHKIHAIPSSTATSSMSTMNINNNIKNILYSSSSCIDPCKPQHFDSSKLLLNSKIQIPSQKKMY